MLLSLKNSVRYVSQIFPLRGQKLISRKLHKGVKSLFAEKLINRKVVRVAGDTSSEFLQGLITNDMNILQNGSSSIYSMFLNSKGRVLFDAIIFKPRQNSVFLIDCDSECYDQLIKHLKTYKLRRKIDITSLDSECHVWAIYNPELADKSGDIPRSDSITSEIISIPTSSDNDVVAVDPRLPYLGYRAIITSDDLVKDFPKNDKFKLCRYKLGVGEGASELQIGQCFPLEVNCDYLNGVSFDKGCYIGQELTARTYHTGVVRKRLMPLTFDEEPGYIPYNSSIDEPGVTRRSPLGKLKGVCEHFGLGLMRVSETLNSKSLNVLGLVVKAVVPYWWPPLPQSQQNAESNK